MFVGRNENGTERMSLEKARSVNEVGGLGKANNTCLSEGESEVIGQRAL